MRYQSVTTREIMIGFGLILFSWTLMFWHYETFIASECNGDTPHVGCHK